MGQLLRKLVNWLTRYSENLLVEGTQYNNTQYTSIKHTALQYANPYNNGKKTTAQLIKDARVIEAYLMEE
jgi:hypothetical protein